MQFVNEAAFVVIWCNHRDEITIYSQKSRTCLLTLADEERHHLIENVTRAIKNCK